MAQTIVEYMQEHGGYRCGYCGGTDTNFSHGMWAHSLSCEDYQDLIDRGWRRSGSYLYKPLMDKMCCPCYTIRCAALDFQPSKSQKKVLKKMLRFLTTGERPKTSEGSSEDQGSSEPVGTGEHPGTMREPHKCLTVPETIQTKDDPGKPTEGPQEPIANNQGETMSTTTTDQEMDSERVRDMSAQEEMPSAKKQPRPGLGADLSKPPCKKAKEMRRQRRLERRMQSMTGPPPPAPALATDKKPSNQPKSLEQLIQEIEDASPPGSKHKLEMRYVRSSPSSAQFEASFEESYAIYHRYQVTVHKDPPTKPSRKQFRRFLVDSPLKAEHPPGLPEAGYGSFHEHFLLDGKIIAVGVIDVLPRCISSVYFYYNPDYSFLSLGTYSALRELRYTRALHLQMPSLEYYYMGFYVHSCAKMRYKGHYHPSYLLCPEAYTWCPIRPCLPKLDASKYSRLDETDAADTSVHLPDVRILYRQMSMRYSDYQQFAPRGEDEAEVREYAQFVGRICAGRMLLYRH